MRLLHRNASLGVEDQPEYKLKLMVPTPKVWTRVCVVQWNSCYQTWRRGPHLSHSYSETLNVNYIGIIVADFLCFVNAFLFKHNNS